MRNQGFFDSTAENCSPGLLGAFGPHRTSPLPAAWPARRPTVRNAGRTLTRLAVLVVHNSPVTRLGLSVLMRSARRFRVCYEACDVPQAREFYTKCPPDLVLLGLTLSRGDGIQLIKDLRKQDRAARILVLTAREDPLSLQRAFRAGARGCVLSCEETTEILRALDSILSGEFYASPAASQQLLGCFVSRATDSTSAKLTGLTDRELQVFRLIGSGFGATRVAAELHVSVKTVESHRSHIKEKLCLATGAELNASAARWLLETVRPTRAGFDGARRKLARS